MGNATFPAASTAVRWPRDGPTPAEKSPAPLDPQDSCYPPVGALPPPRSPSPPPSVATVEREHTRRVAAIVRDWTEIERIAQHALGTAWPDDPRAVSSLLRRLRLQEDGSAAQDVEGFRTQAATIRERCLR